MRNGLNAIFCFHDKRHPKHMGADEVEAFLSSLATEAQCGGKGVVSPLDQLT